MHDVRRANFNSPDNYQNSFSFEKKKTKKQRLFLVVGTDTTKQKRYYGKQKRERKCASLRAHLVLVIYSKDIEVL